MMESFNSTDLYVIDHFDISKLNAVFIQKHAVAILPTEARGYLDLQPLHIAVNACSFAGEHGAVELLPVQVSLNEDVLMLVCNCTSPKDKMCGHQARALYNIAYRDELRIFFDTVLRMQQVKQFAAAYGMQHEPHAEQYFTLLFEQKKAVIKPVFPGLLPVTTASVVLLQEQLLPQHRNELPVTSSRADKPELFLVFRQHKYYRHLCIDLYEAAVTQGGKLKNPLQEINALDHVWKAGTQQVAQFFTGISRFQQSTPSAKSSAAIDALKAVLRNPLTLRLFYHDTDTSENIVAGSLQEMITGANITDLAIEITRQNNFYEIHAQLYVQHEWHDLSELTLQYEYFIQYRNRLHLVTNFHCFKVMDFFRQYNYVIRIHQGKFAEFRQEVLSKLEETVRVNYRYIAAATPEQVQEAQLDVPCEKMLYLSGTDNYILMTPVMRYGTTEVPVLSKKTVYATDSKGRVFQLQRDDEAEIGFIALLMRQHPDLPEQLEHALTCFYLHRHRFLNEDWFLDAFEIWAANGITVMGFNKLEGNRQNPYKAKISIHVLSGANWFNTVINVGFGRQKASMQQLHKAIRNKNKYVQLDDGTLGLIPQEWIEKFSAYFNAGEIIDGNLLTSKINFTDVATLYEPEQLDRTVVQELENYAAAFAKFETIEEVEIPAALKATLRHYQWQGLNWLNFLDDFNFGGCLADDMGLGKSLQVIAFILLQREKVQHNTNLLVVPTSLLFNWQEEIRKFAPSVTVLAIHGPDRVKSTAVWKDYEVVLTTYGTLVSDIGLLKKFTFNYIFLDESQHIKNPGSQRYQAARLLRSRNRIVITGTPFENNTMDLYGQLSFACPGLLGSKKHFADIYSVPIDRFKDRRRAMELQQKISPFILRRTKKQVATELPDKTEMVLYCPMGPEQQKAYDACEKEFRDYLSGRRDTEVSGSMHVLNGITRLRQICNSPRLLADEQLHSTGSAKIDVLLEEIETRSDNHKIIVFSQFVGMLELVKKELETRQISFSYLTGATKDREGEVNAFQQDDRVRIFLISLKAGGVGLNLTAADYVYLVDPWWNPAVENQAIDRCYRIGQKKNVVAVRLICPGTVEEKIMKLQEAKKDLGSDLVSADTDIFRSLTRETLLELVSH